MWALRRPVLVQWAMNSRCERRVIVRVTSTNIGTVSKVISASSGEIHTIIARAVNTARIDVTS